jgi:hypothetical protein
VNGFVPDFAAVKSTLVEDFDGSALQAFKDCHRGERCFILGNGPSLQHTDLAPLADEITIGVNGIFYMTWQCGFTPTYYVVEDNHVFSDNLTRVNQVEAVAKFFPSKYRPIIEPHPDTYFLPTDWSFYWESSDWYESPRFSHEVSKVIYVGQTVTFLNIQLAAYMGFQEIYLVGVDYDYKVPDSAQIDGLTITSADDDPNHFHPDYFGKGKKWHLPKLDNVGKAMVCARDGVAETGASIFNATIGGQLEVFQRADFQSLIDRPAVSEPNSAVNYLVARALERAARQGAKSLALEGAAMSSSIGAVIAASPFRVDEYVDADLILTSSYTPRLTAESPARRVLVVPPAGDPADDAPPAPGWVAALLVDRLVAGQAAFWSRSVLELSPDGESILIPALGRGSQRLVDRREFGVDGLGSLGESRVTRWVDGGSLTLAQLANLADEIAQHQPSFAVVDGYIYVQSRWKPTEQPKDLLANRDELNRRRPVVGFR